jgi:phage-related protein
MKKIIFIGHSLDSIKQFAHEAKREAGHQLDRVQRGVLFITMSQVLTILFHLKKSHDLCIVTA